jgi:hypothetical protein
VTAGGEVRGGVLYACLWWLVAFRPRRSATAPSARERALRVTSRTRSGAGPSSPIQSPVVPRLATRAIVRRAFGQSLDGGK